MEIIQRKTCVAPLVAERKFFCPDTEDYIMFITISPNPRTLIPINKPSKSVRNKDKVIMTKYEDCRQIDQYNYCLDYVRSVYMRYSGDCHIIGSAELNKQGNIHIHMLMKDSYVSNDKVMQVFQRDIKLNPETQRHIKLCKRDYMNNIVELTKSEDEILTYMDKDYDKTGHLFPSFYTAPIDHVEETDKPRTGVRLVLA